MPRYKLTIEYDGTPFSGWQRQDNAPSVQAALERAAEALDGAPVLVYGAGRTDSGVHALGQVAHLDLQKDLAADKVRDALNYHLSRIRWPYWKPSAWTMISTPVSLPPGAITSTA